MIGYVGCCAVMYLDFEVRSVHELYVRYCAVV